MNLNQVNWFPSEKPIYDINKSWEENLEKGPFVSDKYKVLERNWKSKDQWIDFLGHKVASPLGVPAGPLLNSAWIKFAAEAGFDVVTYKTIRSNPYSGHPVPNVLYIDVPQGQLNKSESGGTLHATTQMPGDIEQLAITNSFGMPSKDRAYLLEDIKKAQSYLADGQLMIVSITGTAANASDFIQDFLDVANIALDAGAKVIEVNYSCPNVCTGEGQIYNNPDEVYKISKALVDILQPKGVPLIIKVGVMEDRELMTKLFRRAEEAGVAAIAGINTMSMKITDSKTGAPSLGENRLTSGVCGAPIRSAALDWVRNARSIVNDNKLNLKLLGCGGVVLPEHFDDFLEQGVDIAMSATGLMWDPYIAMKWHNKL
ncbi:dihydroorotate oxidase [Heterostelium album PN500]|uniref:Dihydroorotate oxidase n=1 Tax=Heterostelium pallidum (strain ATCC 26659 / Pp 5 / PN500) TaxID=670386 RepID=D3B8X3_HETP5|nr:dihydroorotate oxidase [Heterostelium album PN500]EFA82491.1 dihydroorotate oxidase [Heterostelium album PN500]|eukprot:XP_020434608.1 dihydroorotate oxidase [Heterostelium album PN500]